MKAKTKKQATRGATAEKRATKANEGGLIPLKKICQDLGLDPKASRVKLRRALRSKDNPRATFHDIGSRWLLSKKQAAEVRAVLAPAK